MDWQLFLCILLTWSLVSASLANRPSQEARSSDDDFVEYFQGLSRSRQKRQTANTGCSGSLLSLSSPGQIRSPNFPSPYPNNAKCKWQLIAPPGQMVSLVFMAFNLEWHIRCSYDSLKIYNGNDTSLGVQLGNYCGNTVPQMTLSSGRYMFLSFSSDQTLTRFGFKIRYRFHRDCHYTITSDSEILRTPYYPLNYPDNTDCVWDITAPLGQVIRITLATSSLFNLERSTGCIYDYIAFHDGQSINDSSIARLCGWLPSLSITSTSNHLYIVFHTDRSRTGIGFQLSIEFTTMTPVACGGQLHGNSGELHSPNFGTSRYPYNVVCIWNIKVARGQIILLEFHALNLEDAHYCQFDAIYMYDGDTTSGQRIARFCGNRNTNLPSIHSTGRYLTVKFTSDSSGEQPGFNATYRSIRTGQNACGPGRPSIVTLSEGANEMIQSSGNLVAYPPNAHCQWQIIAPKGKRVQVHFNSFDFQHSPSCRDDKVELFDGSTTASDTFGKFCRAQIPPNAFSSGNIITVLFTSDSSISRRGFRITLSAVDAGGSEPTCGIADSSWTSGNIVGGQQASPHIWPWQTILHKYSAFAGAGSILSKDWIITAAHLLNGVKAEILTVIVGKHDLTANERSEQIHAVASIVIHAQYNSTTLDSDIALIRLATSIHYTTAIKPICLPLNEAISEETCYATGWGSTGAHSIISNILMEVTLRIINQTTCSSSDWWGSKITSAMLCAGYPQGGRNTCMGDSGGPLSCLSHGKFLLQGITSWGSGCGRPKTPGVFTRVSRLTDWVDQKTNGAFQSAP